MADRNVNININYRINTADLEKLNGAATRADQATQKLQQSAANVGTRGARANQPYIRSIESVRQEMQRTRTLIDLTSRSDTKLLNERIAKYKALKREVDTFNRSLTTQQKQTQGLTSQFNGLFNAVRVVFAAAIVRQVVDMGLSMFRLAGNTEAVDRAFRRAFPNADQLMRRLRESTHGTVTDLDLMTRTLKASNLDVPVQQFGTLLEFASLRAQQTGDSVDYLIDSIVRGLGQKSTRVLDNLGISATRLKEAMGGVSLEAASVAQVTEAAVRIANDEIQKMGGFVETAATEVAQLEVAWFDLRTEVAKAFAEGGFLEFLGDAVPVKEMIQAMTALIESFNRGITVEELLEDAERKRVATMETELFLQRNLTGEREKDIAFLEQTIFATQKDILTRNNLIAKLNQGLQAMRDELGLKKATARAFDLEQLELQKNIEQREKVIEELISEKSHREEWLRIYLQTIKGLKDGNEALKEQLGLIPEVEKQISDLTDLIKASRNEDAIAKWNQQVFVLQGRLSDLKKLGLPEFKSPEVLERVGKVIDEKIKKGFEDSNRELSNIEDTLERLKGAIVPVTIVTKVEPFREMDFFDDLIESINEQRTELATSGIDITSNFLQASMDAELESYQTRIDALQSYYDEQILLAGDNERAKDQIRVEEQRRLDILRRQQAQKEKEARRFNVVIDTAASIAKTAAQLGFPAAIPWIALAIANGALQLAAINKAQPRGFKKGEVGIDGPGTATSDSIPAMLSRGESVINADATRKSFHLLEAINGRKIDDRVLQDIRGVSAQSQKVDFGPVIKAIEKIPEQMPHTDVIRVGATLYETKERRANFKRYVRSKSMSK